MSFNVLQCALLAANQRRKAALAPINHLISNRAELNPNCKLGKLSLLLAVVCAGTCLFRGALGWYLSVEQAGSPLDSLSLSVASYEHLFVVASKVLH